jgi:hypothetical protein
MENLTSRHLLGNSFGVVAPLKISVGHPRYPAASGGRRPAADVPLQISWPSGFRIGHDNAFDFRREL